MYKVYLIIYKNPFVGDKSFTLEFFLRFYKLLQKDSDFVNSDD